MTYLNINVRKRVVYWKLEIKEIHLLTPILEMVI